mgnify:CR=1 FL=1
MQWLILWNEGELKRVWIQPTQYSSMDYEFNWKIVAKLTEEAKGAVTSQWDDRLVLINQRVVSFEFAVYLECWRI